MAGADMDRADRMLAAATGAGSPSTSVITWIGYEAPQNIVPDAASESYAEGAKKDLDRFQDGLRATHEGAPSHNMVIGHSYGSTVIGHTANTEGINADALVFVGSPGVGVDNITELNFPADRVYATVAEHDAIHLSNTLQVDQYGHVYDLVHNFDPTSAHFGAQVFASDPGTPGNVPGDYSGEAHSQYWEPNSSSLLNMGEIIAGHPPNHPSR
jgi:pimeloyl-ACP methyl ester carboxylesterase